MTAEIPKNNYNPGVISQETVSEVAQCVDRVNVGHNTIALLSERWLKHGNHFQDFIHPEFQVFRIGKLGFSIRISPEDKETHDIPFDEISSLGRDMPLPGAPEIGYDWIEAINTMRAFVASTFFEEAKRQGLPPPTFNRTLIDPPPAKREWIPQAKASAPGCFLYEWETLEDEWQKENPALYKETKTLVADIFPHYVGRLIREYSDLPEAYIAKVSPEIQKRYEDDLFEYALRMYAMLTPKPPTLIAVPFDARLKER